MLRLHTRTRSLFRRSIIVPLIGIIAATSSIPAAQAEETYGIWVGSTEVTARNKDNVTGNGTVRYDSETATLYLTNATITDSKVVEESNSDGGRDNTGGSAINVALYVSPKSISAKEFTLHVDGTNTINITNVEREAFGIKYDSVKHAPFVIKGNGTLNVTTANSLHSTLGLQSNMPLTINGSKVILQPGRAENAVSTALSTTFGVGINSGELRAIANYGGEGSAGIVNNVGATTVNGGKLYAVGYTGATKTRKLGYGLRSSGELVVSAGEATFVGEISALRVPRVENNSIPVQVSDKLQPNHVRMWDGQTSLNKNSPYRVVHFGTQVPADVFPQDTDSPDTQQPDVEGDTGAPLSTDKPVWVRALIGILSALGVLGLVTALVSAVIPESLRTVLRA